MNWFKRLCLFVFGLSGLAALAALFLTWWGPWVTEARGMLELRWYYTTLLALGGITALGLLFCLLRALFTPRNPRETIIASVEGGNITVTRAAIVSQSKNIIEADGTLTASSIQVKARKRGHVRVYARVTPRWPINVVTRGEELYAELGSGLAQVCGSSVDSISIVFTDPENTRGATGRTSSSRDSDVSYGSDATAVSLPPERLGVSGDDDSQEVVVAMAPVPSAGIEQGMEFESGADVPFEQHDAEASFEAVDSVRGDEEA